MRDWPLLWARGGGAGSTRAERASANWWLPRRMAAGVQGEAGPHLLHFLGEHVHCMALRISWWTMEPLVQRRGTGMGSVRAGEQQEHWSCTSSASMEYTALLVHLPWQ